jgi:hypothetical protein
MSKSQLYKSGLDKPGLVRQPGWCSCGHRTYDLADGDEYCPCSQRCHPGDDGRLWCHDHRHRHTRQVGWDLPGFDHPANP